MLQIKRSPPLGCADCSQCFQLATCPWLENIMTDIDIKEKLKQDLIAHFNNEMRLMQEIDKANLTEQEQLEFLEAMMAHPHTIAISSPDMIKGMMEFLNYMRTHVKIPTAEKIQ